MVTVIFCRTCGIPCSQDRICENPIYTNQLDCFAQISLMNWLDFHLLIFTCFLFDRYRFLQGVNFLLLVAVEMYNLLQCDIFTPASVCEIQNVANPINRLFNVYYNGQYTIVA